MVPFVLAPLAGISDATFRRICFEHGAGFACSEMISAKGLYYKNENTQDLLRILPGEGPTGYQLFGSEPEIMAAAAKELEDYPNAFIDINMGCPVPKVVRNGEGSALMKDPRLAAEIVRAMVAVTKKPVTVKLRSGWDDTSINAPELAGVLAEAGASAIAVHGRTREQFYEGKANWDIIREVKKSVSVPVIGNGDITSADDAKRMFDETGCDMVMIARGALGNPWIFTELKAWYEGNSFTPPSKEEKKEVMLRHLTDLIELKGEYVAVREMRKHVGWYLKGLPRAAAIRGVINQITEVEELRKCIREF